jgi:hypothetical protein
MNIIGPITPQLRTQIVDRDKEDIRPVFSRVDATLKSNDTPIIADFILNLAPNFSIGVRGIH